MSRRSCRWSIGVLALAGAIAACPWPARGQTQPSTNPAAVSAPPVPYESKRHDFRTSYPGTFEPTMEGQQGLALFLTRKAADAGGSRANLIVATPPEPHGTPDKPLTLDAGYKAYLEMIKSGMKDAKIAEEGSTRLGDEPAKFLILEGHQAGSDRETKLQAVIAVHDGQLYGVFGMSEPTGFDSVRKELDQMVSAWKWTTVGPGR